MPHRTRLLSVSFSALLVTIVCACGGNSTEPHIDPLAITLVPTNVSLCSGQDGTIDLTVSGGTPPYSYEWSNGANSEDIDGISAGTYTVTVTDANSSWTTDSVSVIQPEILLAFSVTDASTVDGFDGALDLSVSGDAIPPYSYTWSNGSDSEDIEGLPRGTYIVTVTDVTAGFKTDSATVIDPSMLRDAQGNIYGTVAIGSQVWMASNFRATVRPDGGIMLQGQNVTGGSWNPRYYALDADGSTTHESNPVLYNWPAAEVLAPPGWHVPSDEEWRTLSDYLAGDGHGGAGVSVADKMKSTESSSGFDGLFTGYWDPGDFFVLGDNTHYWSSTTWVNDDRDKWIYVLSAAASLERIPWDKRAAFSVRLIKDQ